MSQQLLKSNTGLVQTVNSLVRIQHLKSSYDILTLYLVGVDGISMFIGIDHCQ